MTENRSAGKTARDISAALADLSGAWTKQARELTVALQGVQKRIEADAKKIQKAFENVRVSWQPIFAEHQKHQKAKDSLRQAPGLLPHATTPWDLFDEDKPDKFGPLVAEFYETNWDTVEEQFQRDLQDYNVGEEAKRAMHDALKCHRHGLFRSVVLTLLPYVEMEFRKAFEIEVGGNAASLQELRNIVWKMPAGIVLSHTAPLDLLEILDAHLYDKVKTAEALARFEADEIPNRHAAIHGLIEYSTHQNSINTLIVADYVFFLISQLRKHSAE
ncbi:hypothetical protein WNY61_13090 [Sulfitobacter sp. AS92]|uniref:hypothetical protein n=1 Tax=Sulfitobacter sp. AS92 TaxID=3135783 RepID=UPI00317AEA82